MLWGWPVSAVSSLFYSKIEKLVRGLGKSQSGGQNIILCSPWDGPSWHDQRTGGGGQKHLMSAVVRRGVDGGEGEGGLGSVGRLRFLEYR